MMDRKLTAEQVREAIEVYSCAETHSIRKFNDSSWQAIADELNVTMERTCKPIEYKVGNNGFTLKPGVYDEYYGPFCVCSECSNFVPWANYCMECGAKFEVVLDSR